MEWVRIAEFGTYVGTRLLGGPQLRKRIETLSERDEAALAYARADVAVLRAVLLDNAMGELV